MIEFVEAFRLAFNLIITLDANILEIVLLSLKVSLVALIVACLIGFSLGSILASSKFYGRGIVLIIMTFFYFNFIFGLVATTSLIYLMYVQIKKGEIDNLEIDKNDYSITISLILIIIGIACLVFGADLLVDSAINIARTYNVPASVIGLSLVAFGTSLPELAVGIVSAFRKKIDFALGNILGSNIYNVLGVLGISSFFGNFKVPAVLANQDLYFMLSITALILMFMIFAKKIGRIYGIIGLTLYFGYMYFIYI